MNQHARKLLGIYLDDHLAALVTAGELAKTREMQSLTAELVTHFLEAGRELERLLATLGAGRSRVKRALASAAEKTGRVKLNGHIVTRSPLSNLVELGRTDRPARIRSRPLAHAPRRQTGDRRPAR
jgi:hypothetical protein